MSALRGVFVTGTSTGVGKTVACAALVAHLRRFGPVRYWKPVQTGIEVDDDTAEVARLAECSDSEVLRAGVRLERPVSPHLAARLAGRRIDVAELVKLPLPSAERGRIHVVEGAGGVLVPLNESETMADLTCALKLPVVVVASATLGTINHTLLTLEALRARSIEIAGVLMNGTDAENRAAIEHYGHVKVIGEMPRFEPLRAEAIRAWAAGGLELELSL
jgi:dethiobiotin synthase